MAAASLVLRFLLELALILIVAIWAAPLGGHGLVRLVVALAAPLIIVLVWGRWVAPKASARLNDPERFLLEVVLFVIGGVAAGSNWGVVWGVLFTVVAIANALVVRRSEVTSSSSR